MTDHDLDGTVTWRELLAETAQRLADGGLVNASTEARWIVEEASGNEGAAFTPGLAERATVRGVAHLDAMVERRLAGEPIQYVLGHWAFRHLDLLVDRRVLIPRPETEQVVDHALVALDQVALGRPGGHRLTAVDLGTGSGAIALAVATERVGCEVWATDASADALAVARANLAGLGMAGTRVTMAEGPWFAALPEELLGTVDLLISNPPYIAEAEPLDASVAEWEPTMALVPGPTGTEAYEAILAEASEWLAPGGALVLEIGAAQGAAVAALAAEAGLAEVRVLRDHADLDRVVVARRAEAPIISVDDPDALDRAAAALLGGGTVVLPTDTVYGLAALPTVEGATSQLVSMKDRSEAQPFAVLVAGQAQAEALVAPVDEVVQRWMDDLWPGPLTIVAARSLDASLLELGGSRETIGVRCPAHPFVRALAERVGPLATTSANRHGAPTPTTAREAAASLARYPDLVVDGGPAGTVASTVVDVSGPTRRILRVGAVAEQDLD